MPKRRLYSFCGRRAPEKRFKKFEKFLPMFQSHLSFNNYVTEEWKVRTAEFVSHVLSKYAALLEMLCFYWVLPTTDTLHISMTPQYIFFFGTFLTCFMVAKLSVLKAFSLSWHLVEMWDQLCLRGAIWDLFCLFEVEVVISA